MSWENHSTPLNSPIALDATYSLGSNLSGVGVYSREILYGLARLHPDERYLWCYRPHRFLRSFRETLPARCGRRLLWESRVPSCGLFHALNQRMPAAKPKRAVVTFHDLFVLTESYSTPEFRARFAAQARHAAERADIIVCVSAFTAAQVQELLHVHSSRTRVVWHGVHPLAEPPVPLDRREQMILHVGALQKRKNIVRLVEAFESIDPPWRLVLAGSYGFGSDEILQRINDSSARSRIDLLGYVTDSELQSLYRRAGILAFPSLDEGFGIPLLEAMAHGIPILTSNRSALQEVAAGAALLVDPYRVDEIRDALVELSTNEPLRMSLRSEGLHRAAQNTWSVAAEKTWQIYQEVS